MQLKETSIDILVFGGEGQLGRCLKELSECRNVKSIVFLNRISGDIMNEDNLRILFQQNRPKFVINCAAYTAVDKAEDDITLCENINKIGAVNLARCCNEFNASLIHISTDFVFEGNSLRPLTEEDLTRPINIYGQTKLEGELGIIGELKSHYIIRTSWLYSQYGSNFFKTIQRLGSERDELGVVIDQLGTPTYAIDLASVILDIVRINNKKYGVYHYSNEGVASWYDFAKAVLDLSNINTRLNPVLGSAYPTKAKRPSFSVMDKTKIKEAFGITIPYWRDSLLKCATLKTLLNISVQ